MAAAPLSDSVNFVAVADHLGTAGHPTAEPFDAVQAAGYPGVSTLATGATPRDLPHAAALWQARGRDYMHIPGLWEQPTAEHRAHFFQAMGANQEPKGLVPGMAKMRGAAFVSLYRIRPQGVPVAAARALMNRLWQPHAVWHHCIDEAWAGKHAAHRS